MKQKIIIFTIYWLVFFVIWIMTSYFFLNNTLINNTTTTGSILIDEKEQVETTVEENISWTWISVKEALLNDWLFSESLNLINEKFNYWELVIEEFNKVKNLEDFNKMEKKFWSQVALYTLIKLKNKEWIFRYFDYHIEKFDILSKTWLTISEFKNKLWVVIDSYIQNWYYNWEVKYIWDVEYNWTVDIFLVSFLNDSLDKKILFCNEWYKDNWNWEDSNNCEKVMIFMSSTTENWNCDKLKDGDKKWCNDTLKLIK